MTFQELRAKWNESYSRWENNLFEPNEELVKFLARFVVSRDPDSGAVCLKNPNFCTSISNLTVLDIGCGIGAQSEYLARLRFSVIGCDLSDIAIKSAIARTQSRGLDLKFKVIDPDSIPSINCDIAIACASLDSMPYTCAVDWLKMLRQQMPPNAGILFATLIAARSDGFTGEEFVSEAHENGTIQRYFDNASIEELLCSTGFQLMRLNLIEHTNLFPGICDRSPGRYSVVAKVTSWLCIGCIPLGLIAGSTHKYQILCRFAPRTTFSGLRSSKLLLLRHYCLFYL